MRLASPAKPVCGTLRYRGSSRAGARLPLPTAVTSCGRFRLNPPRPARPALEHPLVAARQPACRQASPSGHSYTRRRRVDTR